MENTKRDLSLDFTKPRHLRGGQPTPSLATPVMTMSTPDVHKMISGDDELAVLTPNAISSVLPQLSILPSPLIPTTVNSNNIIQTPGNNNISHHAIQKRSDKSGDQDVEKIEKKRERNRLAAKKCRQRKLETIDELRKTVSEWEQKYQKLETEFERFKSMRNKEIEQLAMELSELKNLLRQ